MNVFVLSRFPWSLLLTWFTVLVEGDRLSHLELEDLLLGYRFAPVVVTLGHQSVVGNNEALLDL